MTSPQLTYYDFGERVVAFSTTRHGGCSTGNYAAFNINAYCGDETVHIAENRCALANLLGIDERYIVMPHQVHGVEVRRIDGPQQEVIEGVDAVMTDASQLCIGVSTADCIPVLLYDDTYGTEPSQLKAVIGPGISLESFEVGDEVYQQFADAGFNMPAISHQYVKWHIDLPMCNRLQLEEMGVKDICLSGICTYLQYQDYFSARRLGINSGRIFTGIMLR